MERFKLGNEQEGWKAESQLSAPRPAIRKAIARSHKTSASSALRRDIQTGGRRSHKQSFKLGPAGPGGESRRYHQPSTLNYQLPPAPPSLQRELKSARRNSQQRKQRKQS